MNDTSINRETMGRLAKSLNFICGPGNATSVALQLACDSGKEADIKKARTMFLNLKHGDRQSALAMISDVE